MSLRAGEKLGSYEIVSPLGAGGMGEVYRARDTRLGRDVAIKVLPGELAQDQDRLARFEREARLLAQLNHPNVATLHGLEESAGRRFLTMELVEGETLAERIARGAVPIDEAKHLFAQIAEGLAAAHDKGIIHRDLKPANIKITPNGTIKILDFGLAKAFAEEAPQSNLTESPTVTRGTATGVILGTAPYMSPEQARGKPVDKRTDVWAFGCCLYEALTARVAFLGETVTDTIIQIVEKEPAWGLLPETTSASIHRLLRRCLQKDPERRLRDIGDARLELETVDETPFGGETSLETGRRPWLVYALGAGLLAALAWNLRPDAPQPSGSVAHLLVSLSPAEGLASARTDFAAQGFGGTPLAVSPDGTHLAFVGTTDDETRLFIRDLAEPEAWQVPDSAGAATPFFSPDGQWVGFFARGLLKKISVGGGSHIDVCEAGSPRGGSWSDRGQIVFAPMSRAGLSIVSVDGGTPEPVTVLDAEYGETSHRMPTFLPGGNAFVFMAEGNTRRESRVVVHSLSSGERRVLVEGATLPRYSPSGHLLYVQGGGTMAAPFDAKRLELTGTAAPILPREAMLLGVSKNGFLVYLESEIIEGISSLVWVDRSGREEPLNAPPRRYYHPRLSPDGRYLTVDIQEEGERDIWTYDIAREMLTRLTFGGANFWPVWTPDGSHVTYASNHPDTAWDVHWTRADGAGDDEVLWSAELPQYPRSWSGNGRTLAFSQTPPSNRSDIWLYDVDNATAAPWLDTDDVEIMPVISPDGRWIAYASNETATYEVYVRPVTGSGKWQISTGGGAEPTWSRDGTELFYRWGNKMYATRVSEGDTFRFGTPTELFEGSYRSSRTGHVAYSVSAEGRFLMAKLEPVPKTSHVDIVLNWHEELKRLAPSD